MAITARPQVALERGEVELSNRADCPLPRLRRIRRDELARAGRVDRRDARCLALGRAAAVV